MNTRIPLLLLGLILAALWLTPRAAATESGPAGNPAAAQAPATLSIVVDPRVELVALAQHLGGYANHPRFKGRINEFDHPYLNQLRRHFAGFKDHPAIKDLMALRVGGSAPMGLAVRMSAPDDVALVAASERSEVDTAAAEAYVAALRAFAEAAHFRDFFDENRASHEAIVADFRRTVDTDAVATQLERYGGTPPGRYVIILAPLLGRTSFGPSTTAPDGTKVSYAILPAQRVVDGRLVFGDPASLDDHLCHEFAHSFINPLVDRHWDELGKFASLMETVRYHPAANYGRDWRTCVCETLVRAVTARIVLRQKGAEAYAGRLAVDRRTGLTFVDELCRALETYEQHRDRYPNLEVFLPELVGVFAGLQQAAAAAPAAN